jgi:hypothetical protein
MTDVLLGITAVPGVTALAEGRVFALTMLYSLNSRRSIRHGETNTSDAHSMTIKTTTDTTNTSRECSLIYRKLLSLANVYPSFRCKSFSNRSCIIGEIALRTAYSLVVLETKASI